MSYILDALRKAEEERLHARGPRLPPVAMPRRRPRRRLWPWTVIAGALTVAAAATVVLVSWSQSSRSSIAVPPVTAAVPAPATPGRLSGGTMPPPALPSSLRVAGRLVARPSEPSAEPLVRSPRSSTSTPSNRSPESQRASTPSIASRRAADPAAADLAQPVIGAVGGRGRTFGDSDTVASAEGARDAGPSSRLSPVAAPTPSASARVDAEPRERPVPALTDLPGALRSAIPPLRLEVLVYAENAADRLVFINSRKYVEGQEVDGKLRLERIDEDGVVLNYHGQRFRVRH